MSESFMKVASDGTKRWENSLCEYHRVDGPAIEYACGHKQWWQNGKHHRVDGPAVEYTNGLTMWYYDNEYLGYGLNGFWALWDLLNEEERQNVNLYMWLVRLQNV